PSATRCPQVVRISRSVRLALPRLASHISRGGVSRTRAPEERVVDRRLTSDAGAYVAALGRRIGVALLVHSAITPPPTASQPESTSRMDHAADPPGSVTSADRLGAGTLEEALHLHREPHVARDLQLAAHEGHLPVELPHDHVDVVRRRHRERHVGGRGGALRHVGLPVLDGHVPVTAVVAAQVELDRRVHALRRIGVEIGGHLLEDFLGRHADSSSTIGWWGISDLGFLGHASWRVKNVLPDRGSMLSTLRVALAPSGLNLVGTTPIDAYDAGVPPPLGLRRLLPGAETAIVIGNGGGAFWAAYRDFCRLHPEHEQEPDPIDAFTRRAVETALATTI